MRTCTANARRPTVDSRCHGTSISCCVANLHVPSRRWRREEALNRWSTPDAGPSHRRHQLQLLPDNRSASLASSKRQKRPCLPQHTGQHFGPFRSSVISLYINSIPSTFCRETARRPNTVGSFRMPPVKVKAAVAAAAAISLGHATCCRQSCEDPADPRRRPQADAVADPLSARESATRFLTHSTHTGPQPQSI